MRLYLIILLSVLLSYSILTGQYQFKNLNIDTGLSQNSVTSITQDSTGALWFSTQDGLNKYTGDFKIYNRFYDDITRTNYNILGKVYTDLQGKVWSISQNGTLEYLSNDHFTSFDSLENVRQILQDDSFRHWILSGDNEIFVYADSLLLNSFQLKNVDQISRLSIFEDQIYYLTNQGIFIHDLDASFDSSAHIPLPFSVSSMELDSDDNMWVGSFGAGLYLKSKNEREAKKIDLGEKSSSLVIYDLLLDDDNKLWIATYGDGLYILDLSTYESSHFYPSKLNNNSISYHDILDLHKDRSGAIWISTDGAGIDVYDQYLQKFKVVTNELLEEKANVDVLRSIFVNDNFTLLGTSGKGLTVLDHENKSWKTYTSTNGLSSDRIMSMIGVSASDFLVGTQGSGLNHISIRNSIIEVRQKLLANMTVWDIYKAITENQYWVATRKNGLFLIDTNDGIVKQRFIPITEGIASIRKVILDAEGILWVATDENGLYSFDQKNEKWAKHFDQRFPGTLYIKSLFLDDQNLYVGTNGSGLYRFDTVHKGWMLIAHKDNGLANNVVYGICQGDDNQVWVSSNRGISSISFLNNLDSIKIKNYTKEDGLQSYEFNTGAYFKHNDGNIYFGGINGMNWFKPNEIPVNQYKPTPQILRFEAGNQNFDVSKEEIILDRNNNSFTIEFVSDLLAAAELNSFQYKLVDYNDDWIQTNQNKVTFMNVPPGHYSFQLKSGNYDGVWNEKIITKKIHIAQSWYLSNYFFAFLIFVGLSILYWFYQAKKRQLRYESELAQNKIKNEMLEKINESKSEMYSNITHEFKNPLTIIKGVTSGLNIEDHKRNLIMKNSDSMLNLVNQLINFSKIESEYLQIKNETVEIVEYVKQIVDANLPIARKKSIDLNYYSELKSKLIKLDKEKVKMILDNLISNSLKYTPENGKVLISLKTDAEHFHVAIKDTGIGIPKEELDKIFDRYYQIDTKFKNGTGVGLTIVKQLTEVLGGEVSVNSTEELGSVFRVSIPLVEIDEYVGFVSDESENASFNLKDKSILVVEDNLDVLKYISSILQNQYTILEAESCEIGLELAEKYVPNLILTDLKFPNKDGLYLISQVKANPKTDHIPIVVVSANNDFETKMKVLDGGASAYIAKPFNEKELLIRVDKLIQNNYKKHFGLLLNEKNENEKDKSFEFMNIVVTNIKNNISNSNFGINDLCRAVYLERSQVYRKIKHFTGMSPTQLIKTIRFEEAVFLIRKGENNIDSIAEQCGYADTKYFSRVFKEEYDISIQDYIKKHEYNA